MSLRGRDQEGMLQVLLGMVKLHVNDDLSQEFQAWLLNLPQQQQRAYLLDREKVFLQTTVPLENMVSGSTTGLHKKAEQAVVFHALALWRTNELRPLTR